MVDSDDHRQVEEEPGGRHRLNETEVTSENDGRRGFTWRLRAPSSRRPRPRGGHHRADEASKRGE